MNICSKCYKDMISKKEQANFTTSSIDRFVNGSSSASVKAVDVVVTVQEGPAESLVIPTQVAAPVENVQVEKAKEGPNRCSTCRRQVSLQALPVKYKIWHAYLLNAGVSLESSNQPLPVPSSKQHFRESACYNAQNAKGLDHVLGEFNSTEARYSN